MTGPTVANRKAIRQFLATMLQAELGSLVQRVYNHQVDSLDDESPVIALASNTIARAAPNFSILLSEATYVVDIHVFVRYQDLASTPQWTEEMSEDRADDIEAAITNIILVYGDNSEGEKTYGGKPIPWLTATMSGGSDIDVALMDNIDYRHEAVHVAFIVSNTA